MENPNPAKASPRSFGRIWLVLIPCLLLLISLQAYFLFQWFLRSAAAPQIAAPQTQSTARVAFQGHQYEVWRHKRTWAQSQRLCQAMGGHLVSINSESEQQFVLALLRGYPHLPHSSCWLGASDLETPGLWRWTTGEEVTLTNHLVLDGGAEHWLALGLDTGKWDDYSENGEAFGEQWFICEWEQ